MSTADAHREHAARLEAHSVLKLLKDYIPYSCEREAAARLFEAAMARGISGEDATLVAQTLTPPAA